MDPQDITAPLFDHWRRFVSPDTQSAHGAITPNMQLLPEACEMPGDTVFFHLDRIFGFLPKSLISICRYAGGNQRRVKLVSTLARKQTVVKSVLDNIGTHPLTRQE